MTSSPNESVATPEQEQNSSRDSAHINVKLFDLILLFPFAIHSGDGKDIDEPYAPRGTERLNGWVGQISAPPTTAVWRELGERYPDPDAGDRLTQYAEWVYFHPFIRSFLYESKSDRRDRRGGATQVGKSMRILRRLDCDGASLVAEWYGGKAILSVRNVLLYLFDTGVGVLSVELERDGPGLTLKQTLDLQDKIRRLYAPYFGQTDGGGVYGGNCLSRVTLRRAGTPDIVSSFDNATEQLQNVVTHLEPHTAGVWRELMRPLAPAEIGAGDAGLRYEQIIDDRMPMLSYLAVDGPRRITEGDWLRLAAVNDHGESKTNPCSPQFKAGGIERFAYDRFWSADGALPAQHDCHQTRWLCCGYSLTAVGDANSGFFTDAWTGARAHARYHYLKLALVAHFHRASLLRFEKRIADAGEQLQQGKGGEDARLKTYAKRLARIQLDLLAFRNMYWFTEVSNQVQPQELFDMMSGHLGTRNLFEQVFDKSEKASQIVRSNREQERNESSLRLGVVAAVFLLVAPVVAALFTTEEVAQYWRPIGAIGLCFGALLTGLSLSDWLSQLITRVKSSWVGSLTAGVLGLLFVLFCLTIPWARPKPPAATTPAAGVAR